MNVYAALYMNGQIMGLECTICAPILSTPVGPDVPLPLHPTEMQLTLKHFTWLDRFPFPKFRDNIITLGGIFDEEDFIADLFLQDSFQLRPEGKSWDPLDWKVGSGFMKKWGYLFY